MSFWFSVLASGSAGNCTILVFEPCPRAEVVVGSEPAALTRRCVLIDAGISPRRTVKHLSALGIAPREISAIVLTHLDSDHFHIGWLKAVEKLDIPIHAHQRHRGAVFAAGVPVRRTRLFTGEFQMDGGAQFQPIIFAHDALGSVGFVIEHQGLRLGFATDLGRVTDSLLEQFVNLHALAMESNYDRQMQLASERPPFLKRRIMGGMGHLSNEQTLEAVQHIESQSHLSSITLLHLSRECNCPIRLRTLYAERAPHVADRLTLSNQYQPTALLAVTQGIRRGRMPTPVVVQHSLFSHLERAAG